MSAGGERAPGQCEHYHSREWCVTCLHEENAQLRELIDVLADGPLKIDLLEKALELCQQKKNRLRALLVEAVTDYYVDGALASRIRAALTGDREAK